MARKETLTDAKGRKYEVELDDDDEGDGGGDDGDEDTIFLDEEDIEWLKKKRLEEAEAARRSSSSGQAKPPKTTGKIVRIRAKQSLGDSSSTTGDNKNKRRRVLRLGA